MSKQSQIEKAIAALDVKRQDLLARAAALSEAIEAMQAEAHARIKTAKPRPRVVAEKEKAS